MFKYANHIEVMHILFQNRHLNIEQSQVPNSSWHIRVKGFHRGAFGNFLSSLHKCKNALSYHHGCRSKIYHGAGS